MRKNLSYILFCIFLLLINFTMCFSYTDISVKFRIIIAILSFIIGSIISFILFKYDTKKVKAENKFLLVCIVLGILFMVALPIGKVPDELNHFLRAYEISQGHMISKQDKVTKNGGREFSTNILDVTADDYKEIKNDLKLKEGKQKSFIFFSNTALYSPICYLPQSIGIIIGKIFEAPLIVQAYLGRICNFIVYLLLMYFAIKYIPVKKNLLLFVSLIPITIQESISLSPDALTIASASALISLVLYLKYSSNKLLDLKQKILIICLSIILAMCKIVYLPVCLMLFLIPKDRFGSLKKKNIFIFTLAFGVVLLNLLWTSKVAMFLDANLHGSSSSEQIKFILHNPISYLKILFKTFDIYADFHIFNMLGRQLSYLDVNVYAPYIYGNLVLLVILLVATEKEKKKIDYYDRGLAIFCFLSTMLLIFTSIYIQWSPYMLDYVDGVQGRYYIPIIILLGISLSSIFKIKNEYDMSNKYVMTFITLENILAFTSLVAHFI